MDITGNRSSGEGYVALATVLTLSLSSLTVYLCLCAYYSWCVWGGRGGEPGSVEESGKFYQLLQECVDEVPKHDMLIVMGDFNA